MESMTRTPQRLLTTLLCLCATLTALGSDDVAELKKQLTEERQARQTAESRVLQLESMVRELGGDPGGALTPAVERWNHSLWQSTNHMLFPSSVTANRGRLYGRIIHVSKDTFDLEANGDGTKSEPFHNLLGLDSNVRIGSTFGFGLTDDLELSLQRTNGRLIFATPLGRTFDYYDIMTKYRWLDEIEDGLGLATLAGVTWMLEDNENGNVSVNLGAVADHAFFNQRLYAGTGLLYTSLSDFEGTASSEADSAATKRHPKEPDTLFAARSDGADHTLSVPTTLRLAMTDEIALYGEAITPIGGFQTGEGPTLLLGGRMVKKHFGRFVVEYNAFVTNSSNTSFNSVLTGGYKQGKLDIFGFNITVNY